MFPLIFTLLGVGVAALAVTWYAVVTAKDGYEDEAGFHPVSREPKRRSRPAALETDSAESKSESAARPCATAR